MDSDDDLIKEFMDKIDNIRFKSIDELFIKKKYIREEYMQLSRDEKTIYKWFFFFQLCILRNPLKELMWEYINGSDNSKRLNEEYINFCEKRENLFKPKQIWPKIYIMLY